MGQMVQNSIYEYIQIYTLEKEIKFMSDSKKNSKLKPDKIRVCITLSPDIHTKIREIGLNLSSFAERALKWVFSHIENGDVKLLTGNNLILSSDLQNNLKIGWTRRDSNTRPPPCQGDVIAGSDLEKKQDSGDLDFSTPPRFHDKPEGVESMVSIGKLYEMYSTDFEKFCAPPSPDKLSLKTYKDYASALRRYGASIYLPVDVTDYYTNTEIYLPEKVGKGWGKLAKMLTRKLPPDERKLNGFPFGDFTTALNDAEKQSKKDNIAYDLSPMEMRRFVENTPEDCRVLFQILAYSGARIEQALKAFGSGKLRELSAIHTTESGSEVFRIDASEFGDEKKRTNYYYLPKEFAETALEWRPAYTADAYKRKLSAAGELVLPLTGDPEKDKDRKIISGKTLRKWLTNLMIKNDVPAEVAGWIEGRVPSKNTSAAAVTWRNYADLDALAAEAYAKMEPIILSALPIDADFGAALPTDSKNTTPKPKSKPKSKRTAAGGRKQMSDSVRKQIIELLKKGESQRAIAAKVGVARMSVVSISNMLKAKGEL